MPDDPINPQHYKSAAGIEVIDVIEAFGLGFSLGNALKYICRHENKAGLQDLKKARWYLDLEIARKEKVAADPLAALRPQEGVR